MALTHKGFDKMFEYVKDGIFSDKINTKKENKIKKFIVKNMEADQAELISLLLKKMARIDKKFDISIEMAEMYSFAITYCIAKKLRMDDKEMNALYDDVNKETKNILEGTMKAKEEMRYLAQMFSLKHKNE